MAINPYAIAGGTALSAIGGGLSAGNAASSNKKTLKEYIEQQKLLQGDIGSLERQRTGEVNKTYEPLTAGFSDNANDYFSTLKNTNMSKYDVSAPENFNFDMQKEIDAQMNPAIDAIINRSTGAVQQSAANRGDLFSGATAKGIARSTADIQAQEYDKAANRAQQQYKNKYGEYTDFFNNIMKTNEFNRGNATANINNKGTLFNSQGQLFNQQQQGINDIKNASDTAIMASKGQQATATAQQAGAPGFWSSFASGALGGAGSAISGLAGGT